MKEKCRNFLKRVFSFVKRKPFEIILGILFLASIVINILFVLPHYYGKHKSAISKPFHHRHIQKEMEKYTRFDNEKGVKEEYSKTCVNGVCTTHENKSELSEEDIKKIHAEIEEQHKRMMKEFQRMNEYFEAQDKLFKSFWVK